MLQDNYQPIGYGPRNHGIVELMKTSKESSSRRVTQRRYHGKPQTVINPRPEHGKNKKVKGKSGKMYHPPTTLHRKDIQPIHMIWKESMDVSKRLS